MSKKRKDHEGCSNEETKRSKLNISSIDCIPETPKTELKGSALVKSDPDPDVRSTKLDFDNATSDEFSDDDNICIEDLNDVVNGYAEFSRYERLKVLKVEDYNMTKVVQCKNTKNDKPLSLVVSGQWYFCDITEDCYVHLIGKSCDKDEIIINSEGQGMLVIHPDILVSPTTISSSVRCARQAVLGEVFKPTVGYSSNEAMLLGTINHSLFDVAVRNQCFDPLYLNEKLNDILATDEIIDSMSCMGVKKEDFLDKLVPSIKLICTWGKKYCNSYSSVSYGQLGTENTKIEKVLDIEENIWSPKYGCKGKVDATVRIHNQKKSKISLVEVKSGASRNSLGSIDHRAQVILYTMMLEERYKGAVDSGLLYYIKGQQTIGVPSSSVERKALIMKRNEVANSLRNILQEDKMLLPDLVSDKMACKWCNHQLSCSLAYKSFEKKCDNEHPFKEILDKNTSTLSKNHLDYFELFTRLCILETEAIKQIKQMPWNESCKKYSHLTLETVKKDQGFYHLFKMSYIINTRSSIIKLGDYVLVSRSDGSAYNLCSGFVTALTHNTIEVVASEVNLLDSPHHRLGPSYQVTLHSSLSNLHTSLGNVTSLMGPGARAIKWRRLIIDKARPGFNEKMIKLSGKISGSLNEDQKAAVLKATKSEDYLCIVGMPGTGKTTTISSLIELLVSLGYKVLLTAYTHSAVDNMLLKLPADLDLVRLGAPGRVHQSVQSRTSQVLAADIKDPVELRRFYEDKAVVATTCLGLRHSLFEYKHFDYCIVDEASQITQPICIGPILHADRCILVGDHNQLPPLVQNTSARDSGLGVSLFARLCESHPTTGVCELHTQYRMCSDVMLLSNTLVYENKLKCANEQVARSALSCNVSNLPGFSRRVLLPATKVVFLNTSNFGEEGYETSTNSSKSNNLEAKIVKMLCDQLTSAGVPAGDIGVLTMYNGQVNLLTESLSRDIEILTADRYQGRDKPCVIISFVRSNKDKVAGPLLVDKNRINVALTRSKSKLIMIGDRNTIQSSDILKDLLEIVTKKKWVCNLNGSDVNLE